MQILHGLGRKKLEIVNLQDKCIHVSVKYPMRHNNTGCSDAVQCLENKLTFIEFYTIRHYVPQTSINFIATKRTKN